MPFFLCPELHKSLLRVKDIKQKGYLNGIENDRINATTDLYRIEQILSERGKGKGK